MLMGKTFTSFVDFIIPTYQRYDQIKSMLYSLVSQYNSDWSAQVIIDDIENNTIVNIIKDINDSRISYSFAGQRYNDWGHTPREIGKQRSESEYIIMTGDDNYYVPTLVDELKYVAENNSSPALIYWDMIHSHKNYHAFYCILTHGGIDIGAFATRSDIAKTIKLSTNYAADGEFITAMLSSYPLESFIKINKFLYVHN